MEMPKLISIDIPEPTKEAIAKMERLELEDTALALWGLKEMWAQAAKADELVQMQGRVSALTEERDRLTECVNQRTKELQNRWQRFQEEKQRAELAEQRFQSMREALTEQAAKAICKNCRLEMPFQLKEVFGGDLDYYHVFVHSEDWWRKAGLSEWSVNHDPGMKLNVRCSASKVRAALSAEGSKHVER